MHRAAWAAAALAPAMLFSAVVAVPAGAAAAPLVPSDAAVASARAWAVHRHGRVAFAVVDSHQRLRGVGSTRPFSAASVIKAMLLVAYLRRRADGPVTPHARRVLGPMIRRSSNTAARRLFRTLGPAPVLRLARQAHMRRFALPSLFEARITAADQARLFARLDAYVPGRHRAYARALLASIVPEQRWGIPRGVGPSWQVYFKGGWRRGLVHQVARVEAADGAVAFALAVLTDHDRSEAYGQATVEGIAARLVGRAPT
jgi:beta-lactamase class A